MSNHLAIATVTAALSQLLQAAAAAAVPGATTGTARPGASGDGTPVQGINVFLYQVTPNPALRNADLPSRREDGSLARRIQVALDLHYLLSFYGNEQSLEPQRLLGSAVSVLNARPVLSRGQVQAVIDAAVASDPAHFLAGSDLPQQVEMVRFTPLPMTLEDLARLWSTFFQTPYVLSMAYQGAVVLIESEETPQPPLPVLGRNLYAMAFRQPVIERVIAREGPARPIVFGGTILLTGKGLRADEVLVRVGESEATPDQVTDTQVSVTLSVPPFAADSLRAGVRGVQVVHPLMMGTPPAAHRGGESNVAPLALRPVITLAGVSNVLGAGPAARSADVTVDVTPGIGPSQRVVLLLNEVSGTAPAAYSFRAGPVALVIGSVTVPVSGVRAAEYFVRLQVDGAESLLDLDPASPTFGPRITVP